MSKRGSGALLYKSSIGQGIKKMSPKRLQLLISKKLTPLYYQPFYPHLNILAQVINNKDEDQIKRAGSSYKNSLNNDASISIQYNAETPQRYTSNSNSSIYYKSETGPYKNRSVNANFRIPLNQMRYTKYNQKKAFNEPTIARPGLIIRKINPIELKHNTSQKQLKYTSSSPESSMPKNNASTNKSLHNNDISSYLSSIPSNKYRVLSTFIISLQFARGTTQKSSDASCQIVNTGLK